MLRDLHQAVLNGALQRSSCGLRLVGYPTAALQELFDGTVFSAQFSSDADVDELSPQADPDVLEALPDWQNPDGEALWHQLCVRTGQTSS